MKKIITTLLAILLLFTVTACGPEKNNENNGKQQENQEVNNNTSENKQEEQKPEPEKQNETQIDDEIIDFEDEDNQGYENGNTIIEEVINCDGCVYAYFSEEGDNAKTLGSTLSTNEYTTDINNLKTSGGKQRHNFFGLVLSGNTISKAYACILKDNKIYCIEGSTNGAYHNSNIAILNKIFTGSQCRTISDGNTHTCTDGSYNGDSKTSGYTSMHYETSCVIYGANSNTGKLICH
jgi:predicted small lipoprotein YifL